MSSEIQSDVRSKLYHGSFGEIITGSIRGGHIRGLVTFCYIVNDRKVVSGYKRFGGNSSGSQEYKVEISDGEPYKKTMYRNTKIGYSGKITLP